MKDYIKQAVKTKTENYNDVIMQMTATNKRIDILHAAMGITTEAGEIMDQLKRHFFYGKGLDIVNVKEELGDLFWYIALMCDALNFSFEEIQEKNIDKLRKRYKDKFTAKEAIDRDVEKEREVLEE
jgi:NTP pyrophosphatase (non-canonical NTP hydrolase)